MSTIANPRVNAWIFLGEDDPGGSNYLTPGSSYQNLIQYGVYGSTDMVSICWVDIVPTSATTIPAGDGSTWTVQLQPQTHPGGYSNQQYMDWMIQDSRNINPGIKLLVMLGWGNGNEITQMFTGDPGTWPAVAAAFADNLVAYLQYYGLNGFDVDWESPLSSAGTTQMFSTLFSAVRAAFNAQSQYYYLVLSPAEVGTLDAATVNADFDFVNLQLYSGFSCPGVFESAGIDASKFAYGAKFEVNGTVPYQTAQQAYALSAPCRDHPPYDIWTTWRLNSNDFQYEQAQQMILYQLVYGIPGTSFDDSGIVGAAGNPPISQMVVRHGEVLDAIQATSTGSFEGTPVTYTLLQHGGNGGTASTVTVAPGDAIVQVSGYTGNWFGWNCVLQITLTTANGQVFGPFGSMANSSSQTPFSFTAPQGQSVVAFSGSQVTVPVAGGGLTNVIATLNVTCAASTQTNPFRMEVPREIGSPAGTPSS